MPLEPRYPPSGPAAAALTPQATRLAEREPERFALECVVAEQLLGLDAGRLSEAEAERARLAVALQVGMQVEQGIDAAVYEQVTAGPTTLHYRAELLHPVAARLVQGLRFGRHFEPVPHL